MVRLVQTLNSPYITEIEVNMDFEISFVCSNSDLQYLIQIVEY